MRHETRAAIYSTNPRPAVLFIRLYTNSASLSERRRIHGRLEFLINAYLRLSLPAFALVPSDVYAVFADNETVDRPGGRNEGTHSSDSVSLRDGRGGGGRGSNLICGAERGAREDDEVFVAKLRVSVTRYQTSPVQPVI